MGIEVDFFPAGASQKAVAELLRKAPYSLVWVENPCNPLLTLTSIRAMASAIQDSGSSAMLAVDNTFAGPLFHHPLEHGADLVMYVSLCLCVCMSCVCVRARARARTHTHTP